MNKKKITIYFLIGFVLFVLLIFSIRYFTLLFRVNSLNKQFELCKYKFYTIENYYGAKKCFSDIIDETNKPEFRYYHALSLFKLKEFQKSKKEFKEILDNSDKIKNKKIVERAQNMYNLLNNHKEKDIINFLRFHNLEISEENSRRLDIGDYYSDLGKVAVWKNPKKINVYVEKSKYTKLFKKAFMIWDEALANIINFSFVENKENADITCESVNKLNGIKLGSTETRSIKDKKTNKKYLTKAKIEIALYDPYFGEEISEVSLLSTTLHEIGHSIGIISHSPQKGDIMYMDSSGYRQNKAEISNRDVNTVKKIYGNI